MTLLKVIKPYRVGYDGVLRKVDEVYEEDRDAARLLVRDGFAEQVAQGEPEPAKPQPQETTRARKPRARKPAASK